jgi:hypothetical protein
VPSRPIAWPRSSTPAPIACPAETTDGHLVAAAAVESFANERIAARRWRRRPEPRLAASLTLDVKALIREQGVQPVQRLEDLAGDFWPPDEDVDVFVETIYRWRREER